MGSGESKKEKNIQNERNGTKKSINVTTKLVQIKIRLKSGKIWDKTFNVEETLSKIETDFKIENNMDTINTKYFIEWTYKNSVIEMNSKKIKKFIEEKNIFDGLPIEIHQEIKPKEEGKLLDYLEICDIFGKPLFNPFKILIIERKQKLTIKENKYNKYLISQVELNKFSIESAFCNGNNHLYISGGVDPSTRNTLDLLWDIDLKSDNLESPKKIFPKQNHSMIYADKKVFIVGGNDTKTLVYDTENKNISNLCDLNLQRFEPSLIKHDNYLFCFDSSKKKNNVQFNFERIDLNNLTNSYWEIIYPKISPNLGEYIYNQKFYGVVEDYNQNIIFIGGIYDNTKNYSFEDNDNNMEIMNIRYNIPKNIMEKSDIAFQEISLSEKTFLPLDYNKYFILPNYSKRTPEIVYYNREENKVQISSYKSEYMNKKKNKTPNLKVKASLFDINFDMPGLHREIDLNNNFNNNNIELEIIEPNVNNNEITMNNPNLFNIGSSIQPFINKTNCININKDHKKNNLIDINSDSVKNININNIGIDTNIKKDTQINSNKPINNENNLDINLNKRKIDKENENIEINKDIKINIIEEKLKDINIKKKEIIFSSQGSYKNWTSKFHNSVNDPCNYIEQNKKKNNLVDPKYISPKLIKRKANHILNSEKNELRINNY